MPGKQSPFGEAEMQNVIVLDIYLENILPQSDEKQSTILHLT